MNPRVELGFCRVLAALGAGQPQRDDLRGLAYSWPHAKLAIAFEGEGPAPGAENEGWEVLVLTEEQVVAMGEILPLLLAVARAEREARLGGEIDGDAPTPAPDSSQDDRDTDDENETFEDLSALAGLGEGPRADGGTADERSPGAERLLTELAQIGLPPPEEDVVIEGVGICALAWPAIRGYACRVCLEFGPAAPTSDLIGTIRGGAARRELSTKERQRLELLAARRSELEAAGWHVVVVDESRLGDDAVRAAALSVRDEIANRLRALNEKGA
jgi:hypothetical protein